MTRPTEPSIRTAAIHADDQLPRGRSSWGAIFAGVVAAFAVMLVLEVLMLWLGLSAIDPVREANPLEGLATGTAIGYLVIMAAGLFVGGLVTGRLANRVNGSDVFLHGFLTWGVFTLGSLVFALTSAGLLVGGSLGAVGRAAGAVGGGAAAFAPDLSEARALLEEQLDLSGDVLDELEPLWTDPGARRELRDAVVQAFDDGDATVDAADRQNVIDVVADNTDLSEAEIEARVDAWIERFEEAQEGLAALEDDLRVAGEEAADALAGVAMWAFFGLILGAIITWLGARAGAPGSRAAATRA